MNRTHARQKSHSPSNTSVGLVSVADVLRVLSSLKMIGLHVFTVVLVVIMVNLGFWQLRRHEERVTFNDAVRARAMQAPRPPDELLALDATQRTSSGIRSPRPASTWSEKTCCS